MFFFLEVSKWACSDSKITKINTLKSSLMYSARSRFRALESGVGPRRDHILLDYILCTGHFSGIEIWKNKQVKPDFSTIASDYPLTSNIAPPRNRN